MNENIKNGKNYLYLSSLSEDERREFLKNASTDKKFLTEFIRSIEIDAKIEEFLNNEDRSKEKEEI